MIKCKTEPRLSNIKQPRLSNIKQPRLSNVKLSLDYQEATKSYIRTVPNTAK